MVFLRFLGGVGLFLALALSGCNSPPETNNPPPSPETSPEIPAAVPPPPPQGAFLAQLTPDQTAQLKSLGVEVAVPGVVPPTFSVVEIQAKPAAGSGPGSGASYAIVYQDSTNRCFIIEFAADGIGDPPVTEHRIPIHPPLFTEREYGLNYGVYQDQSLRKQFPEPELFTDWLMGNSGAYRLIGGSYIQAAFPNQSDCKDITPEEAVQIVESLTVITSEVIGDGEATK